MDKIEIITDSIISEVKFDEIHLLAKQLIQDDKVLAVALFDELNMQLGFGREIEPQDNNLFEDGDW